MYRQILVYLDYQALRTVRELAYQDGNVWPLAAANFLNDTFVNDVLIGTNTEDAVLECQA